MKEKQVVVGVVRKPPPPVSLRVLHSGKDLRRDDLTRMPKVGVIPLRRDDLTQKPRVIARSPSAEGRRSNLCHQLRAITHGL